MTTSESLRHTVRAEQHYLSHELAEKLFSKAQQLLSEGYDVAALRRDLDDLFEEYRVSGQEIQRDALVEVLDELDSLEVQ